MAKPRKPGPNGALSEDDRALWQHVTKETKPLKARDGRRRAAVPEPPGEPAPPKEDAKPAPAAKAPPASRPPAPAPRKAAPPPLSHGQVADVDRRSAARLKRGQLPVEAALDLHGHTQKEAHGALDRFLAESQARGLRCVLIITGKGVTKEAGGVLRAQVPRWLNEPVNRERILAFDYAQPKDGGLGALYILLRRKREERRS